MTMTRLSAAVLLWCAACHFQDTVAMQNRSGNEVSIAVTFSRNFAAYDCATRAELGQRGRALTVSIPSDRTVCFIGPYGGDDYRAVDELESIVLSVNGAECHRGGKGSLPAQPIAVGEKEFRGFVIDASLCRRTTTSQASAPPAR